MVTKILFLGLVSYRMYRGTPDRGRRGLGIQGSTQEEVVLGKGDVSYAE